jgi:predicted  nucleic acid-binding Zn-ribbon protein
MADVAENNGMKKQSENAELTIENKLMALYSLQQIDSQTDKIRIIRGELPLEVQDLEDEIAGLRTRVEKYGEILNEIQENIRSRELAIMNSNELVKKYNADQMNVRNNREYDALSKEIEFQTLEIQLNEKKIKEAMADLEGKREEISKNEEILKDRTADLDLKKSELKDIVAETELEEKELLEKSHKHEEMIEERLLTAYKRIRKNARNGLAVVTVQRDACGGCFSKIPPQRQLDIRTRKKIIVCEYCGRILVDNDMAESYE